MSEDIKVNILLEESSKKEKEFMKKIEAETKYKKCGLTKQQFRGFIFMTCFALMITIIILVLNVK